MLCLQIAEQMSEYWDIEVLTTCAKDYISWKNEFKEGMHKINNISVRRFKVDQPRRMRRFNLYSKWIYNTKSSLDAEERWIKAQGPSSSELLQFIETNHGDYQLFFFFTYLYYTTYFGLQLVRDKSVLIPTAHDEPPIHLSLFQQMFQIPKGFIYSTLEEEAFVNRLFNVEAKVSDVIGTGVMPPDEINKLFRGKYNIKEKYILYVGRIDVMKGGKELFAFFRKFKKDFPSDVKLVLMGPQVMSIPKHPDIIYLGTLPEEDKFDAIQSSEFMVVPSRYESLSIVALESWVLKKPVLVNQRCDVLFGQCKRSDGGLAYHNYETFCQGANALLSDSELQKKLGENGHKYTMENYHWDIIKRKYLNFVDQLQPSSDS